jgi:diguanylate cyclase (GGDEF)-like protein
MNFHHRMAFRFWLAINSLVLTGIISFNGVNYWREAEGFEDALRNEGITAANTFNSAIGLFMLQEDYSQIAPLAYSLLSGPNIAYVIVKDKNGTTVNQKVETVINKENIISEKVPLQYFQENVGEVEIGLKTDTLIEKRENLLIETIIYTLIFSCLSLIISYLMSRRLTSPINKLIVATKKMSAGERTVEVIEDQIYEIQQLADSFNKMTQTISNHEGILVDEIQKATKDLSEKISILEVLENISSSVLENNIQRNEVMKSILQNIKKHSKADRVSLAFLDKKMNIEIFVLTQEERFESFNPNDAVTFIHKAIETKQVIIINHIDQYPLSIYEKQLLSKGINSLLILPIIAKKEIIGTLNIACTNPDYFSKDMVDILSIFTNQIALAIDRVTAYESLRNSAFHDYLTDLPNYRLFNLRLKEEIKSARENPHSLIAVMFLDLDRFKSVNDTLGHATGDLLLKEIGKKLLDCVSSKGLVSRFGGDEFSILLPHLLTKEEAVTVANTILTALEEPIMVNEYEVPISASIGIAFFPNDGKDASSLIRNADRAMYRIKEHGKKNFSLYNQSQDDLSINPINLENDLRKALEKNEFVVYYQPKINIKLGTISGLEALVRWKHPEKGIILPGHFISFAEETGLIVPIGEFVLREACKQSVIWQSLGITPIPISVNLSTRQLLQSNLVGTVEKIIKESKINPDLLELEITESMSMDIDRSIGILRRLKKLGVRISVDDFGTGYSSLNYLRQLPIDRVKIDKSFIRDISLNSSNEAIVATIINMAQNLGLQVTAEGVEEKEQVEYLQKNDCDEIQGFYFSKPLPPEDFLLEYSLISKEAQQWRKLKRELA